MKKINRLEIYYEDNTSITFGTFEIEKLENLNDAMEFVERARRVYENLRGLFKKDE